AAPATSTPPTTGRGTPASPVPPSRNEAPSLLNDSSSTVNMQQETPSSTMQGTPTRVGGGAGGMRAAAATGVMKEDGEAFDEPPEVAAASAAASASASGTETREDLDVDFELQAAAANRSEVVGSGSSEGGLPEEYE
ncbi:unnamed protein product, partial [Laminaria digitata]